MSRRVILTPEAIARLDTDALCKLLIKRLKRADKTYFAPLIGKDGCIPIEDVSDINRLTAELTSRYLCSGF